MLANQGLLGIAFFETTASIILLVLFLLFRRDHGAVYFRFWLIGWCCFTLSAFCELALLVRQLPGLNLASVLSHAAALILFLIAVVHCSVGSERRIWSAIPLIGLILAAIYYVERRGPGLVSSLHWETAIFETVICLLAGWMMWRAEIARVTGRNSWREYSSWADCMGWTVRYGWIARSSCCAWHSTIF